MRAARHRNNHMMLLRRHSYLVVVSSLLDELVDYFLGLFVTFLLQVSNECVKMTWTVICFYYRLMSLNDTSNACKHTPQQHFSGAYSIIKTKQQNTRPVFLPSSSSVRVSANMSSALFSPKSPPVAKSRFSSALEASCVNEV